MEIHFARCLFCCAEFFDPKPFVDAANILTAADDPLLALKLLEMVPAYYRQHPPAEIEAMRRKILSKIVTVNWYAKCEDIIATPDQAVFTCKNTRRGVEMVSEVSKLNIAGKIPFIVEMAPARHYSQPHV